MHGYGTALDMRLELILHLSVRKSKTVCRMRDALMAVKCRENTNFAFPILL